MTKLLSNDQMIRYFRQQLRQKRHIAALTGERAPPKRRRLPPSLLPAVLSQPLEPETPLGEPTPEREERAAGAVSRPQVPPFNSQILGVAQKFSKSLGPELMIVLEKLHEVGTLGASSRGLTQSYEGPRVDGTVGGYEHLSAVSRDAAEQYRNVMAKMPPELRAYVKELVLEDIGIEINSARGAPPRRARTVKEIGQELSGYEGEQRAMGAVVVALRIIAWIARSELGFTRRRS